MKAKKIFKNENLERVDLNKIKGNVFKQVESKATEPIEQAEKNNMSSLDSKVKQWAKNRGIDKPENAHKQYMKVMEEMGEIAAAINKNDSEKLIDGFGDVQVTLIILAEQLGVDYYGSLNTAYDVIKNRTGKTINGVFIKDEDLNK